MISIQTLLSFQGFPVAEARKKLQLFSQLDRSSQKRYIEHQKKQILDFHMAHNPMYRNLTQSKRINLWSELPIITKGDLQMPLSELLSDGYKLSDAYVSNTSGSSGHPFFFTKDKMAHAMTWAFILEKYAMLGIKQKDIQARFYGIPLDNYSNFKERVKDYFMHRVRFPVFNLGEERLEKFLEIFKNRTIHYVYGYTNSILLFTRFLQRKGIRLVDVAMGLKLCIVTSEMCSDDDKRMISTTLGVPVIREYGASELDVIAIEGYDGRWVTNECNLYIEVLSEDNQVLPMGESGRLVITSLHNMAMPFIRYDIGDIGTLEEDDHGVLLKSLTGRVNDTIILPSGKKSPGLTFYYVSRSILESSGVLKEFIVRQTALNAFEFDIVSDRALTSHETQNIREKMDLYLEPGLELIINRVDKIKRPPSGKSQHFYSELKK